MMNVMKKAWEIYRTLTGDHRAKLAMALRKAWAETKNAAKKAFDGFARVAKIDNAFDECHYFTFKLWEKGSKRRIYINDYKRRTIGYIENEEFILNDKQGNYQSEIDFAINNFRNSYAY